MERLISIDPGKSSTKVKVKKANGPVKTQFPTRVDEVDINEEPEEGTNIAIINGKAYRVGKNAVSRAPKSTTKMTEHHLVSTWTALALNSDSGDVVNVSIGCPLSLAENVNKKNEYKDYILPKDEIEIQLKTVNGTQTKHFRIGKRLIAPEGSGIIFKDPDYFAKRTVAIIDLGGLNFQAAIYVNGGLKHDQWICRNNGGRILIDGLTDAINSRFSTDFDRTIIESKMFDPNINNRFIRVEGELNSKQESAEFIKNYLAEYTRNIFKECKEECGIDPLNMETWMVGGTSKLISEYAKSLYGDDIHIAEDPEWTQVDGGFAALERFA